MTSAKPKLIFLWNYVEWGGAQIYLLAIMKEAKADFDIVVILPRDTMPDILYFLEQLDISHEFLEHSVDNGQAAGIRRKIIRQLRRIRAEFGSFQHLRKYDLSKSILHIDAPPWQSWVLLTALAARKAHVFTTMHNFMPRSSKIREFIWKCRLQFVSRLPGFHIFPSNEDTKTKLKGWVSDKFWREMVVTSTAVNPTEIEEAAVAPIDVSAIRDRFNIDREKFVFLCVGQFVDRKGRWVYLDAAARVSRSDESISFVWLTPQLPTAEDLARIDSYQLGDTFKLVLSESVGKTRNDVLTFIRMANGFALASLVEGLPIALLEAMALGLPCISTNINAVPEAIKNLETGILIEAGDPKALADAFLLLKNDVTLRERLANQGREFVLQNFDERKVAQIAINSYERSLSVK